MQFKILPNIYPCRLKLFQWKIVQTDLCQRCDDPDNLLHHFFYCNEMVIFWSSFKKWWSQFCDNCGEITPLSILLGTMQVENVISLSLTLLYFLAKWYIYRNKYLGKRCCFLEYLPELKNRLLVEKMIFFKNNQFIKFTMMWEVNIKCFVNILLSLEK